MTNKFEGCGENCACKANQDQAAEQPAQSGERECKGDCDGNCDCKDA